MGNTQTRATKKWQEKAGLVSKSYKIKKELAERFAKACEKNGEAQAAVISRLMEEYISKE